MSRWDAFTIVERALIAASLHVFQIATTDPLGRQAAAKLEEECGQYTKPLPLPPEWKDAR